MRWGGHARRTRSREQGEPLSAHSLRISTCGAPGVHSTFLLAGKRGGVLGRQAGQYIAKYIIGNNLSPRGCVAAQASLLTPPQKGELYLPESHTMQQVNNEVGYACQTCTLHATQHHRACFCCFCCCFCFSDCRNFLLRRRRKLHGSCLSATQTAIPASPPKNIILTSGTSHSHWCRSWI